MLTFEPIVAENDEGIDVEFDETTSGAPYHNDDDNILPVEAVLAEDEVSQSNTLDQFFAEGIFGGSVEFAETTTGAPILVKNIDTNTQNDDSTERNKVTDNLLDVSTVLADDNSMKSKIEVVTGAITTDNKDAPESITVYVLDKDVTENTINNEDQELTTMR